MAKQNSDNLSKGDVISFVALLLMGVAVFFGMNFKTLGDRIPSLIVAVLLVVVMTVFVFLAAHAKAQNRNQSMWRSVEYAMLGLYVASLIPCYIYVSKFLDIYFNKTEITKQVQTDINGLDKMFSDYKKKCESRCSSYQIRLDAMLKDAQGRTEIAKLLETDPDNVTQQSVQQAVSSFSRTLEGGEFKALETQKNSIGTNLQANIKNWNILFIPQYVAEMQDAKSNFAVELANIYNKHKNNIEKSIPEFNAETYASESDLADTFTKGAGFSLIGLLAILILGGLGLVKYLLGEKRTVIDFKEGNASTILEDGGFTIG